MLKNFNFMMTSSPVLPVLTFGLDLHEFQNLKLYNYKDLPSHTQCLGGKTFLSPSVSNLYINLFNHLYHMVWNTQQSEAPI